MNLWKQGFSQNRFQNRMVAQRPTAWELNLLKFDSKVKI